MLEKIGISSGFAPLLGAIFLRIILFGPVIAGAELPACFMISGIPSHHFSDQRTHPSGEIEDLGPFSWMIKLYQRYISPMNGAKCPMEPSCSSFAAQALRYQGEKGLVMVFDRLIRCGRDLEDYTLVFKKGRVLHDDPVIQIFECITDEFPK